MGDVNGDGNLDVVVANASQRNRVCLGDGSGGFSCDDVSADTNLSLGVALGDLAPPPPADLDHYLFYNEKLFPRFFYNIKLGRGNTQLPKFGPVKLADQFGSHNFDVSKGRHLGLPADKNAEGVIDEITHLFAYPVRLSRGEPRFQKIRNVRISNQCNDLTLQVKNPRTLLVPTNKSLAVPPPTPDPVDHNLDHFLCYDAKVRRWDAEGNWLPRFPRGIQVDVEDQFQTRRYDLRKITKLCNPVDKSGDPVILRGKDKGTPFPITPAAIRNPDKHLVCYQASLATIFIEQDGCGPLNPADRGTYIYPPQKWHSPVTVSIDNQFESRQFKSRNTVEFCIPSAKTLLDP